MTPDLAEPAARLAYQKSLDCVHCGLCTQACPTYRLTGRETQNPRGRIYLMRALLEGRAEPTPDVVEDLDACLVCRACEPICPSGVRFGELMAHTRAELRKPSKRRRRLLREVVPDRAKVRRLATLVRFWQTSGLRVLRFLLPSRLRRLERSAPRIAPAAARAPLPRRVEAVGERRGAVAFFEGCVMPELFPEENRATVALFARAGFDVVIPAAQTCCGALHEHDGDLEFARTLATRNADAFDDPDLEAVVTNSAGCGAALRGASHLVREGAAERLSTRAIDWSRFLLDRGATLEFRAPLEGGRVIATYEAPCQPLHAQGEAAAPLELLRRVPGLELRPMDLAELCCGAAGAYALDRPETSRALLAPKLDALAATGAEVLFTGNPGCLLQWRQGVAERGLRVRVEHPAKFLADRLV
ncbi:MAG TPA: (Fe-S)-binding protein [Planctomycetota bacterium]|nr:(Fe-S)-binding protein [Planctomycetota bacterium]